MKRFKCRLEREGSNGNYFHLIISLTTVRKMFVIFKLLKKTKIIMDS